MEHPLKDDAELLASLRAMVAADRKPQPPTLNAMIAAWLCAHGFRRGRVKSAAPAVLRAHFFRFAQSRGWAVEGDRAVQFGAALGVFLPRSRGGRRGYYVDRPTARAIDEFQLAEFPPEDHASLFVRRRVRRGRPCACPCRCGARRGQ